MNKTSLKLFAIEARNELMEKMRTRLDILGITKNGIEKAKVVGREVEINGSLYPKGSYNSLVRKYKQIGYEELVEESAYTWFNRLTALAFMEANEYIDEKMIFNNGLKNEPGIIDNYYDFEFFKNLDSELQKELHDLRDENTANSIEKLYSILVEEKCEELSAIMPFMFKKKGTYSDILFPTGLLLENSLLVRIREEIGKEAPIELIGWLYQFYNSEKKDEIFAKKEKISKENVPAVTQLFTPDWIVKYMVENSLGKLALESTGINENLKDNWKYYIESELDKNSEKIKIEDVKILDPAMGSGHILVYAFDLLFEMYENLGWSTKDTVLSILKNNLYGLEIDERAGQLASFALMMKAREKFSRLFSVLKREETFKLNTLIIEESNSLSERVKNRIKANNLNNLNKIIEDFEDAKEYGSIFAEKGTAESYSPITYAANNKSFDFFQATSRDEKVPSSVVSLNGGNTYNNFDTTSSLMYSYTPDATSMVPERVTGYYGAGRLNHGSLKFKFDNAVEDNNSAPIPALEALIDNYTGK